jgi:lipoprotein-anchoring transpeptidase ErfK/SrfK
MDDDDKQTEPMGWLHLRPSQAPVKVTPEDTPKRAFRWWPPHRPGRRLTIALAIVGGLFVAGGAGASYAAYDLTQEYEGKILPGTEIAGVDVSGMDRAEALQAVEGALQPQLERTITLQWEERSWDTTPVELGARSDAEQAVDAALDASSEASFMKRMRMAVIGEELGFERLVAITYPRREARGFVKGVASGLDRDARDASVDYSTGWVEVLTEQQGRAVDVDKSHRALMRTLRSGSNDTARLAVATTEPEVTSDAFKQVLLLRIGENKLYLYEDGEITHEYTVATGQPEYPTPEGTYEITEKRYLPTWVNPDPEGWGKDMPASIPPGPGNPLGLRALNWSAAAIRFHGTSATYSLGYNASHGCVRMANESVIELYDLVDVGTPIVSTVVAPLKPMYVSAPDPTVVAEDEGEGGPSADADDAESKEDSGGKDDRKSG